MSRRSFRKERLFKTKTEATQWENEVKDLLRGSIPEEDIKRLLDEGLSPKAIPEAWESEQTPTVSLLEWTTAYLDHAKMSVSEGMYREKRSILSRFLKQHGRPQASVENLTVSQAYDYLQRQAKRRSKQYGQQGSDPFGSGLELGDEIRKVPSHQPFPQSGEVPP